MTAALVSQISAQVIRHPSKASAIFRRKGESMSITLDRRAPLFFFLASLHYRSAFAFNDSLPDSLRSSNASHIFQSSVLDEVERRLLKDCGEQCVKVISIYAAVIIDQCNVWRVSCPGDV